MGKLKYQNYRVCYDKISAAGTKIYELHKYCECPECRYRQEIKRTPCNSITITTRDILKVDEVAEFLNSWICKDGKRQLEIVYIKF